jgi:hypothetical protein
MGFSDPDDQIALHSVEFLIGIGPKLFYIIMIFYLDPGYILILDLQIFAQIIIKRSRFIINFFREQFIISNTLSEKPLETPHRLRVSRSLPVFICLQE